MQFFMIMMTKAYHTFLGFSWHILFADVAVINITFQVIFTYDIFLGVIRKALIGMGVIFSMAICGRNIFFHGNLWKKVFLK